VDILILHERAITLLFWPNNGWWRRSLLPEICAQSDTPLRNVPTSTDFRL